MTAKKRDILETQENPKIQAQKMLTHFGLSENEAKVYTYLLDHGDPTLVSKVASGAGLHRQYVYLVLPRLIESGLVEGISFGKMHKYKAKSPKEIEKVAKRRIEEAEDIVRTLEKFSKVGHEQDFEVIQGEKAIQRYEMDFVSKSLDGDEDYIIGGASDGFSRVMGDTMEAYLELKKKKNIKVKYIGGLNEVDYYHNVIGKHANQEYRFLEKLPRGVTHFSVRKDSVCFFSFLTPPLVYVVKSPVIARNYRDFFLMLWDMAKVV